MSTGKHTVDHPENRIQVQSIHKTQNQKAAAEAKNWTKVIKAVRSPKSGAYTFKEAIIHKDKIKDFLSTK